MALDWRFVAGMWLAATGCACAQTLNVRSSEDHVHVSAPSPQFLTGKVLERLRNGAPVKVSIQLSLLTTRSGPAHARSEGRFALSFDLWEERFAVTRLDGSGGASNLSAVGAERWCLESLPIASAGLSPDSSFWIRLDVRAEEPPGESGTDEDAGISLTRLVELFSRQRQADEAHRRIEAGPFRLKNLR